MVFGSFCLHGLLARWLKIDVDTFLVTSAAAILSVPLIPAVAGAIRNRDVLVPGFAVAILGYILSNYAGIMVAALVKSALT